jgi:hypothetical protein
MPMAAVNPRVAQDMLRACLEKGGSVIPGHTSGKNWKTKALLFPPLGMYCAGE